MRCFISYWFETHGGGSGIDNLILDIDALPASRDGLEVAERRIMELHGRQNGNLSAARVRIANMILMDEVSLSAG